MICYDLMVKTVKKNQNGIKMYVDKNFKSL